MKLTRNTRFRIAKTGGCTGGLRALAVNTPMISVVGGGRSRRRREFSEVAIDAGCGVGIAAELFVGTGGSGSGGTYQLMPQRGAPEG